ncbi:XRE family transcriptional regulator [bacterium]|nr:MAG: XRE family transcriptional regulator [bacterium]
MTTAKKKSRLPLYSAYVFRGDEKDPIIDTVHTWLDDAGLNYAQASERSGVSASTLYQWIEGKTKRPQFCTVAAVAGALDMELKWVKRRGQPADVSIGGRQAAAH